MLRSWITLAFVAIVFAVGSSDAANCTATTIKQDLDAAKVVAADIIIDQYALATKEQIIKQVMDKTKDTIISFDYTVTQKDNTISIDYKIISACNETTTTVLPDGTKQTKKIVSTVDQNKVKEAASTGLS